MRKGERRQKFTWQRSLTRLAAFLFVIYALADVTVLQAYCGNEAVGIPSYAEQLRIENDRKRQTIDSAAGNDTVRFVANDSDSSNRQETPEPSEPDEECFCCCPHTTLALNHHVQSEAGKILPIKHSESNFSDHQLQSNSHLARLYQPPKSA